jgi:parallel beta-helix repeat protein
MERKVIILALILAFFISSAAEAQFAYTASAQYSELVIIIRDDGSIDPSTAPIQRMGDVYSVTSDLSCNTVLIQRDNVVFDGAYHIIELFNGFSLSERENVTVTNVVIKGASGIGLSGQNNRIVGNTFHINETSAVAISNPSSYNIISGNTIELKNGTTGVYVFKALDTVISNNTIFTAEDSVQVWGGIIITLSHNTTVVGNSVNAYATYGIAFLKSVTGNSPDGEMLSGVALANSVAGNYSYAVYSNCPNVDIIGNNITGKLQENPDSCGIMLREDSNNNIISQNYVANNGYGIYFQPFLNNSVESILNFSVFENNFVDNNIQAKISMTNCSIKWDNGEEGNYWSDYQTKYPNASESSNSGIGDTPYIIDESNRDNYPLMMQYEIAPTPSPESTPKPEPFPVTLVFVASVGIALAIAGLVVYFKKRKQQIPKAIVGA